MASRDAIFRMALEADQVPSGSPLRCPRCRTTVDVRRYPDRGPMVGLDCWRCHVTWDVEQDG